MRQWWAVTEDEETREGKACRKLVPVDFLLRPSASLHLNSLPCCSSSELSCSRNARSHVLRVYGSIPLLLSPPPSPLHATPLPPSSSPLTPHPLPFSSLLFSKHQVDLPTVPLGVPSTATFWVINQGYGNLELRHRISPTIPIELDISYPDGPDLGALVVW